MADRLPVLATARDAYAFVWRHRRRFFALAFPAIVVLSILTALVVRLPTWAPSAGDGAAVGNKFGWGDIVGTVAELALWVMFAVAWHRRYLVPAEATTVGAALRWQRRQNRFLLVALGISGVVFLGGALAGALAYFGPGGTMIYPASALAFLFALYVYARLALLFPAAAVDHHLGFTECFKLTRRNGWRLVAILALVVAPFWVALSVGVAATVALGTVGGLTGTLIGTLFHQGLNFAGIAVGVSALSIAYRELVADA